jgi:hypothetical protein
MDMGFPGIFVTVFVTLNRGTPSRLQGNTKSVDRFAGALAVAMGLAAKSGKEKFHGWKNQFRRTA